MNEAAKAAGAPIVLKGYLRFALGEGIEKETSDFAAEWLRRQAETRKLGLTRNRNGQGGASRLFREDGR